MRLLEFLKNIDEEGEGGGMTGGEVGSGATTSGNIAQYPQRLPFTTRRNAFISKKKKKKRILPV